MPARKMPAKRSDRIRRYDEANRQCAAIILANAARYGWFHDHNGAFDALGCAPDTHAG